MNGKGSGMDFPGGMGAAPPPYVGRALVNMSPSILQLEDKKLGAKRTNFGAEGTFLEIILLFFSNFYLEMQ